MPCHGLSGKGGWTRPRRTASRGACSSIVRSATSSSGSRGPVIAEAGRLVETHPLRAYDAVQLACALLVRRGLGWAGRASPRFVAADAALLAAARAESFLFDNPLEYP